MDEMLISLFVFALGLVVWAAIGHGLWIGIRSLFVAVFGTRCHQCGRKSLSVSACPICALHRSQAADARPAPTLTDDLAAASRLLTYSKFNQWLDEEQLLSLTRLLDRMRDRVQAGEHSADASLVLSREIPPGAEVSEKAEKTFTSVPPANPANSTRPAEEVVEAMLAGPATEPPVANLAPVHPLDAPDDPVVVRAPRAPVGQRMTAGLLKSFMEQSNIRWIELISATLIVVCSVGLVISLWSTLSSTSRFFPSLVFLLATAAVHGAGQYTLRQWKLRSTSRGILHIGLMLIPLAVLVGILLARREGGPPIVDMSTWATIGVGALVYGTLAVTASRALFGKRWPLVAAVTIVCSLTLLPVYYLGGHAALAQPSAVLALVPMVLVSLWGALITSLPVSRGLRTAAGVSKRVAGVATQIVFAIAVVFVFWFVESRRNGGLSVGWWMVLGSLSAGWASWGWANSLPPLARSTSREATKNRRPDSSWLSVGAWGATSLFTLLLASAIWQVSSGRFALSGLLLATSIWWIVHGLYCNLRLSLFAGGLSGILGLAVACDGMSGVPVAIQAQDWLRFPRIASITALGVLSACAGSLFFKSTAMNRWASLRKPARLLGNPRFNLTVQEVGQPFIAAGSAAIFAAACLTLLASWLPWGEDPYGGNWAALMLISYGVLGMVCSIWLQASATTSDRRLDWLMPIGQGVLLLGTIRLCQTSPMLTDFLASLRPWRAWGVGTAMLALGWSIAAAALGSVKPTRAQHANMAWLCGGSIALGLASVPPIWSLAEDFYWASLVGWYLPVGCLAIFIAWRQAAWREATLLLLAGWLATLLYSFGAPREWWVHLELAGSTVVFAALLAGTVFLFELIVEQLKRKRGVQLAADAQAQQAWQTSGPYWAGAVLLVLSWMLLLMALTPPALVGLATSLGLRNLVETPASAAVSINVCGWSLVSGIALAVVGVWIGRARKQHWLVTLAVALPMLCALTAAGVTTAPYALSAALWVLAAWLLASELLPLLGRSWSQRSSTAWQELLDPHADVASLELWLPLGRAIAMGMLMLGSAAFACSAFWGQPAGLLVASETLDGNGNVGRLLLTLGPICLVSLVRWIVSLVANGSPRMIALSGSICALALALVASLGLAPSWPFAAIVFLQGLGLVAASLAWGTLGFVTIRNLLGLKKLVGAQTAWTPLLPKSIKGNRWKQCEAASWSLISQAMFAVVLLAVGATMVTVAYPAKQLPGIVGLGGPVSIYTLAVSVSLFCLQARRRGASRFGLLALALGLAAPFLSTAYASALIAEPASKFPAARDFEPYRALVVLWLVTLCIGLAVRFASVKRKVILSTTGESAWILLAAAVASLALVSALQDPNFLWPFAELCILALLAALSGAVSQQAWRGHLAAIAAAAGMWSLAVHRIGGPGLDFLWMILWGPVGVAFVALAARLLLQQGHSANHESTISQSENGLSSLSQTRWRFPSVDQTVSLHVPILSALFSFAWIVLQSPLVASPWTGWIAGLATACLVLATARLWDQRSGKRGLSVYLSLLSLALVMSVSLCAWGQLPRLTTWLLWMASGLGAMACMAALLHEWSRESSRLGPVLRFGALTGDRKQLQHAFSWMLPLHTSVGLLTLIPCVLLVLALEERTLRVAATVLPFIGALSILPLAAERCRNLYRYSGLLLISSTLVLLWWADLPSAWVQAGRQEGWLYVQRAFAALIAIGVLYPTIIAWLRGRGEWERPLMNSGWLALSLGIVCGSVLLVMQLNNNWESQSSSASLATKLLTLCAWLACVARLLQFSVRPHSTDQNAPIVVRKASVYGAQFAVAGLCAAGYFHFPHLFGGILAAWWPLLIFAVAMLSAGLGEWLHRMGESVVADPVRQSSLLLPIIPLAGVWWIQPASVEWLWRDWDRYSLLLLTAASLYAVQGWVRKSVELRALSAGLVLLSFWSFLHSQPDYRFLEHPQFWLLPPSLAMLGFVEANRRRLDVRVLVAARYLAILLAYLSSTAEVFLQAFEGRLWQPLLLLILALAGVAAGIVLRVRAFLYCGIAFMGIALLGMVWHAQQAIGQVWPWWAFGIATGVGLIFMLGYYEKNRPRVIAYLEQFKQWEQ